MQRNVTRVKEPTTSSQPRSRRTLAPLVLFLASSALIAGCGKKGVDAELLASMDAGRNVSAFSDADPSSFSAKRCQSGTIDGMQEAA